ncbi:hypothetical protein CVU82_03830 [Candidatus Falkowbacteria bacterium HGW-Falkowbacteria-1]|uniref:DUF333 domain-containing protein n=1 Tax=Candidatus Falkowbacteria bacterium HGW-Falkowbacteria-1 TaxID=2013768 RepID=A0A2N2E922_9BACT|nr:MAG: hypothetical protein CVU82_03830 [Candidatus Falkowbacteria bacterium HGW-Falkowbacteria-1]
MVDADPSLPNNNSQLANPASSNCVKLGGNLVIEKRGDGGEYGLCYFENDMACEEWALFRGNCPVGGVETNSFNNTNQKYCVWSGGKLSNQLQDVCVLSDGVECSVEKFYNGDCPALE